MDEQLSIKDVKEEKSHVEFEIKKLLEDFYQKTGLVVESVDVDHALYCADRIIVNIKLEVKL